jgi:hypothetical protein
MATREVDRPDWKVYHPGRGYVAGCKFADDAAVLVAAFGEGAQIKYRHHTLVWTEGKETQLAEESYEFVAQICVERVNEVKRAAYADTRRQEAERRARIAKGEQS